MSSGAGGRYIDRHLPPAPGSAARSRAAENQLHVAAAYWLWSTGQTDRRTDGQCTVTQTHALTARSGQRNVATHTFFSVVDIVDVFPKELFRSLASRVVVVVVVGGLVVAQLRVRVVVEHNAAHKVTGAHLDVLREQQVGVRVVRLEAHLRHSLLQTSADEPVTYR